MNDAGLEHETVRLFRYEDETLPEGFFIQAVCACGQLWQASSPEAGRAVWEIHRAAHLTKHDGSAAHREHVGQEHDRGRRVAHQTISSGGKRGR